VLLLSALLAIAVVAGAAGGSRAPDEILTEAGRLTAIGSYRDAQHMLQPLEAQKTLTALQQARRDQLLAVAYSQTGPADLALHYADRAEREGRAANAFDVLARVESVRGLIWMYRGRSADALPHLGAALTWAQKSQDRDLVTAAYTRLAAAYQDLGDSTRALDALNRSIEANPNPGDAVRLQSLTRRGLVEGELHDAEAAKAHIREALALTRRIGDRRSEAQVLIDLARTCDRFDADHSEALSSAEKAVEIAREIHVPVIEIGARNQLGSLLRVAGRLTEARQTLEAARDLVNRSHEHRDEPYVLKNLGQVLTALGSPAEGESVLRKAANRADADNLTKIRWVARFELAQMHAQRDPEAADREFQEALAILEEQQTSVLLEGFRAGALDETLAEFNPYDRYISFLLDRGESARAFHVAERQRARAFLDTLSVTRDALARQVPAAYSDKERRTLDRIKAAQAALRTEDLSDTNRAELVARVSSAENELTQLRLRFAIDHPSLAQARYPKLWEVRELQTNLLQPDESLLSIYLGAERSVAWIVTRRELNTIALPPAGRIDALVREALAEIRNPLSQKRSALMALSQALSIDQMARNCRGMRLVIVPHKILYDIPFEALLDASGRPLIERFAISYAPSASSLAFLRSSSRSSAAPLTLLAVANPIVTGSRTANTRAVDLAHINLLQPLPQTEKEVRGIAALFGESARVLDGQRATRLEVANGLDETRILHFATHGLIDEDRPERSGLVLTADPPRDDGLLQMRDIYSLRLRADLVTLSACETALGRHATGEGIIGLTRAFFYAGAQSVVASLWDVDDAATSEFMQKFYASIRRGESIDIALQRAKLDFIRAGGRTSAPFYWASFIVSGQARTAIRVPPPASRTLPLAAALTGVLALALWYYRRIVNARRGEDIAGRP
jgi:CHAT domain-containing protein